MKFEIINPFAGLFKAKTPAPAPAPAATTTTTTTTSATTSAPAATTTIPSQAPAPAPDYQKLINDYINKIGWDTVMTPEQHKEHAVKLMNLQFATTPKTSGGKRKKPKTGKPKRKRIRVKKDVDAI